MYTDIKGGCTPMDYKAKYDKENTVQVKFKFNKNTDQDIIEHLNKQNNKQGYIKKLIRKDIGKEDE